VVLACCSGDPQTHHNQAQGPLGSGTAAAGMPPFAWLRLVLAVAVITPAASLASVPALTHARPVSLRGGVSLCAVVQPSPPPVAPAGVKPPLVTSRRARIADAATAALCGGQPVAAIAALFALNELVRVGLLAAGLAIPSSLVAMLVVFATLCLLSAAIPSVADAVAGFFAPGAGMLNRWLATFYVPSLLAFPVTAPDLAPLQIAGCVGLCVLLLLANIAATATACQWLGESESASSTSVGPTEPAAPPATAPTPPVSKTPEPAAPTVRPPAPADVKLGLSALLFGLAAALGSASGFGIGGAAAAGGSGLALSTRLAIDAFITAAMFGGLCAASRLPRWLAAAVHPIFVSTGAAAAAVAALAAAGVGAPMAVLRAYLYEPALRTAGGAPLVGGGALTALLGPTVVSFGLQMHGYRGLMVTRAKQVGCPVGCSYLPCLWRPVATSAGCGWVGEHVRGNEAALPWVASATRFSEDATRREVECPPLSPRLPFAAPLSPLPHAHRSLIRHLHPQVLRSFFVSFGHKSHSKQTSKALPLTRQLWLQTTFKRTSKALPLPALLTPHPPPYALPSGAPQGLRLSLCHHHVRPRNPLLYPLSPHSAPHFPPRAYTTRSRLHQFRRSSALSL
jgi:hypothetical protein